MDPAIVIAVAGLVTTACSPLILTWRNARNQHTAALGDLKNALYVDATVYTQSLDTFVQHLTEPYSKRRGGAEPLPPDALTARMRLIAPENVQAAWAELLDCEERLQWTLENDYMGLDLSNGDMVPDHDTEIVRLRAAISAFYDVTRRVAIKGK